MSHELRKLLFPDGFGFDCVDDEIDVICDDYDNEMKSSSKSKYYVVRNWRLDHPFGTASDCANDTGLSLSTVYAWWRR